MKKLTIVLLSLAFLACKTQKSLQKTDYKEQHRPQFHFSEPYGWMNDPNGLVYYEGEYHLFYQYYPDATVWGPMHWAHAVSKDMVHWQNLPIALYPDSLGYIFSGSAVVDWKNTSGFGKNGKPPLLAIYTYHYMPGEKSGRKDYQSQAIAYSNDKGRTWTKYKGNPVIPNPGNLPDIRDPKVFWHEASGQWVVALAVNDHLQLWGSKDFKSWKHLSDFGKGYGAHNGVWECPDLIQLKADDGKNKWVLIQNLNPGGPLYGSGTQYFVGNFDGTTFTLDPDFAASVGNNKAQWLDFGADNYAGVTWADVPAADGRSLFLGWMGNWEYAQKVPTGRWRSAMTLPRSLELKKTPAGYRVFSQPVKELQSLRDKTFMLEKTSLNGDQDLSGKLGFSPTLSEVELEFTLPTNASGTYGVTLSNSKNEQYRIGYDASKKQFFSDRLKAGKSDFSPKFAQEIHYAPRMVDGNTVRLHIFFDVASAELFADGGATVMTEIFFPNEDYQKLGVFGKGAGVSGKIYSLKRIW